MGAFVLLSRNTPKEEQAIFDPDKSKRLKLIDKIRHLFPEEYEIIPAGRKTIDFGVCTKEHGVQHVLDYLRIPTKNAIYFGDNF